MKPRSLSCNGDARMLEMLSLWDIHEGKPQVWIEADSRERRSTFEVAVRRLLSPRRLWSMWMLNMVLKALVLVLLSFDFLWSDTSETGELLISSKKNGP